MNTHRENLCIQGPKFICNIGFSLFRRRAFIREVSIFIPQHWGEYPKGLDVILKAEKHSGAEKNFLIKNRSKR